MTARSVFNAVLLGAGLALSQAGSADEGNWLVRLGTATVAPDEDSSRLDLSGVGAIGGSSAGVDSNTQLGITFAYRLSNHWGLGLLAATPFEHDVTAATGALGLGRVDAGSIKHLPPTLTLQYYPMERSSAFQPYIGAGINYTIFFSEDVDSQLESVLGPGDLELDDSLGLAAEVGADIALSKNWSLNAALWYLDIDTEATFKFDSGARIEADVDVDPWVYALTLGYRF